MSPSTRAGTAAPSRTLTARLAINPFRNSSAAVESFEAQGGRAIGTEQFRQNGKIISHHESSTNRQHDHQLELPLDGGTPAS